MEPPPPPTTTITDIMDARPKKHSAEFFAARIQCLQNSIKAEIEPSLNDDSVQNFVDVSQAFYAAMGAKTQAEEALADLQREKDIDPSILKKAEDLVDSCDKTVQSMWICEINAGKMVLTKQHLQSLEAELIECTILVQSTPQGLADFCAQDSDTNGPLVDDFLSNPEWMKSMITHGGASQGRYGPAIRIHSLLQDQIQQNPTKMRRKLALAVALEFATDIAVFHDKDTFIDPSKRFWHYVNAYENNELDDMFDKFSVWELRHIIDGDATEEDLQWGRDYLKAYRPDEILREDYRWKYVWAVRSDMNYHHPENDFSNYKELLSAGGQCGPRAWFGRFIAKAWGTPTWGCRQPGHAALTRWTPQGWVTDLGAGFQFSHWTENRYNGNQNIERNGLDFEEETKARMNTCPSKYYQTLTLLECLAESMGEILEYSINPDKFWRSLSLVQRRILAQKQSHKDTARNILPYYFGESNILEKSAAELPFQDPSSGCFIIPASTCTTPTSSSMLIIPSFLGGHQVHLTCAGIGNGKEEEEEGAPDLEYTIPDIIPPGSYNLSCRVVNINQKQMPLQLTIENFDDDISFVDLQSIDVPYTVGKWQRTKDIRVQVQPGSIWKFSRERPCHGLSIKSFMLEKNEL